ncbi:MAG TPA: GNAT family N-acetyltransferase [Egicoccus sp.]|nr:GNAT family N-acetyltransferase [Egicoccus sp.]HSK22170.1 GNAT family N-acetyltransferase [Egicoccus sp.]
MDDVVLDAALAARVSETWQQGFEGAAGDLGRPGTTLLLDEGRDPDGWIALWPAGERVVTQVAPAIERLLRTVLADRSAAHRLTADEVAAACWPDRALERQRQHLYVLDVRHLPPVDAGEGRRVVVLDESDRPALDALLARCSQADREEGDVDIGGEHEVTAGVYDGPRLVAVASMYAWRGFSDIGVLTDPAARGQGAGSAAVAALCHHLADHGRVVVYRHERDNLGSRGIARSLGLVPIGIAEAVRPAPRPG